MEYQNIDTFNWIKNADRADLESMLYYLTSESKLAEFLTEEFINRRIRCETSTAEKNINTITYGGFWQNPTYKSFITSLNKAMKLYEKRNRDTIDSYTEIARQNESFLALLEKKANANKQEAQRQLKESNDRLLGFVGDAPGTPNGLSTESEHYLNSITPMAIDDDDLI